MLEFIFQYLRQLFIIFQINTYIDICISILYLVFIDDIVAS